MRKRLLMVGISILLMGLWGCGESQGSNEPTENIGTEDAATEATDEIENAKNEPEEARPQESVKKDNNADRRYHIGDAVEFMADNGDRISVTLTDWGPFYDDALEKTVLYVSYFIENTGQEKVMVGPGLFDVYADDYDVGSIYVLKGENGENSSLSAGRKTTGRFYADINPDTAGVIEAECGGSVFVLKDESMVSGQMSDGTNDEEIIPPKTVIDEDAYIDEPYVEEEVVYTGSFDLNYPYDGTGNYILPDSDVLRYKAEDLLEDGFNADMCRIAKNEIYARHGRKFSDAALQDYFDHKLWYNGEINPDDFNENMLTEDEKNNISQINAYVENYLN